jgi:hypothetical protein
MAVTSLDDHVSSLLSRSVAEGKTGGVTNSTIEATAVFESVALNLLLKPRSALYFALLARNGLQRSVQDEISLLEQLKKDIQDLGNTSFKIQGAATLQQARTALLQLEKLPRMSSEAVPLQLYSKSVDSFLEDELSRNVRRKGSDELVRPSAEAHLDLVAEMQALKEQHADTLDRLYNLTVGIDNFLSAPFNALIGTSTIARARLDLESIINQVEAAGDPSPARDYAIRLIGSRETIKSIASPPSPLDTLFPFGTAASSAASQVQVTSAQGPFLLGVSPVFTVTVNGRSESSSFFAESAAILVSSPITFPLTIPASYGLFVSVDGVQKRIPISGTFASVSALCSAVTSQALGFVTVSQFAHDPSRWVLYFSGATKVAVLSVYWSTASETTTEVPSYTALSAHTGLGFAVGQVGLRTLSAQVVADAVNSLFTLISATALHSGQVQVVSLESAPGTTLTLLTPASFGLTGTFAAMSDVVSLVGVTDHREIVQVGDRLVFGETSTHTIIDVRQESVTIDALLPTRTGPVAGISSLTLAYDSLISTLKNFVRRWGSLSYASDLNKLDRTIAPLEASSAPGQRNTAIREAQSLEDELSSLLNLLSDPSTMLPDGAALEERQIVEGILTTLQERHYDRAADLLLKCDVQALLGMDADQASYGGNFMRAASGFAQANFLDEDTSDSDAPSSISAGHA